MVLSRLLLVFFAIAMGATDAHANEGKPTKRPNILIVLSDDHSAAHVGCYGNTDIRTPNLDRFASQGMRFNRAYVTTPQCVPSRASIMTGRSPIAIQMTRFSAPLPIDVPIFPEILRAQGFYAGVAGRTYHLDGSKLPAESKSVFEEFNLKTFSKRLDFVKTAGKRPDMLNQYREFLKQVPKGSPFVLQLCFSDPHRPYDENAIKKPHDPAKLKLPPYFPDTPKLRQDFAHYYDEISRFDEDFGQVLAILEEMGLADNTIVLFMGDNGAAILRGKGTLYEFGLHVPLLVRWPGHTKGMTSDELISGEDIAPTMLEAVGWKANKEMTGKSFVKLLKGEPFEGRKHVFAQRGAHGSGLPANSAAFDLGRCVITKEHKLIYNALWQIPYTPVDFAGQPFWKELQSMHKEGKLDKEFSRLYFSPTRPMFELYDTKADPHEMRNLIGQEKTLALERELKGTLQRWMILERDFVPLPVPPEK